MSEVTMRPTTTFIPEGLKYPTAIAKHVNAYNTAHETWRKHYLAVVAATEAITHAPAKDAQALVDAVAAGKGHPGVKHAETSRQELELAEEKCRVAREAATAQTDVTREALAESLDTLIPLVLANIRAKSADYTGTVEDIKAKEIRARSELQAAVGAFSLLTPGLNSRYGLKFHWDGATVSAPNWPPEPDAVTRRQGRAHRTNAGRSERGTSRTRRNVRQVTPRPATPLRLDTRTAGKGAWMCAGFRVSGPPV